MTFDTLDTITEDLLKTVRGSEISSEEPISKLQIESWVHQYRAVLLTRDLEKKSHPNPDYIQTLSDVTMDRVEEVEGDLYRSVELPNTLDLKYMPGFTYVGDASGNEYHYVPEHRAIWQSARKYTPNVKTAYLKDGRMYINNWDETTDKLYIRGIFENPMEAGRHEARNDDLDKINWNSPYPFPADMLPTLKELILSKELKITVGSAQPQQEG